eukprot:sb/3465571/
MSNEKDLDSFRQAWKFELSSPQESRHARAKKLYLKGVELEREGMCYEAIEFFRQALKLVPDLEKHVDVRKELENFNPSSSSSSSTGLEFYEDDAGPSSQGTTAVADPWMVKFNSTELDFDDTETCERSYNSSSTHISYLPNEIVLQIFGYVVSTELDMKSLETIAGVCKWFYKLSRTPRIWQAACFKIWPDLRSQISDIEEGESFTSWRGMFINRPHLRFDGVYISRIKYYREGEQKPSLCCSLQTVFYHRFLRFFSDGLVLGMNTPTPPQQAVALLKDRSNANKDVLYGQYTITGDLIKITLFKRDMGARGRRIRLQPDLSYNATLQIVKKGGKQTLNWVEYNMVTNRNGKLTKSDIELEPPHFCRFMFSRVKSYTATSAGTITT